MEKIVIVYGFDYDYKIWHNGDAILCKSIFTHLPVYASPIIIEDIEMDTIYERIKEIEKVHQKSICSIYELARSRRVHMSWKMVIHGDSLKFDDVGYESEGDENGDSR